MHHVDAIDGGDLPDIVQALARLDHADHQGRFVEHADAVRQRQRPAIEVGVEAGDRALADRRELAGIDSAPGLFGRIDVGKDDPGDAIVQHERDVGIIAAAGAHQHGGAAAEPDLRQVPDRLQREQRMLRVDEHEVMPARFGDADHVAGARQPHDHAERHRSGLHARLDRIDELGEIGGGHRLAPSSPIVAKPVVRLRAAGIRFRRAQTQ